MSGPDLPDPERGFATPGVDPRRVPPSDEQATTALPRHPTPPEHYSTVPTPRTGPSDEAATTWYPRPDPPPRRDDGVYRDPYPDRAPGAPPYDDRKSPYDHRARPDDSKDPRRRPYPPDDEYYDRRPPSEYRDQRGYPADDPTGRGGGRAGNGAGYGAYYYGSDGPDYYGPDYYGPDYNGADYGPDYSAGSSRRRRYDDRPYLDGDASAARRDPRPIPRAADPYDYLPPGEPMPGGGDLEPVRRHEPTPRGSHLPPYQEPLAVPLIKSGTGGATGPDASGGSGPKPPRKLTVTRVAALRSREITRHGVEMFQRAAKADGADRSGLTHLTYAVMANYAVDAALAIALANTLFFAAATAESPDKVLLYLLITVAPFAVIAPLIGPALDRLQSGRRLALAASSFARAVLALIMVFQFDSWVLYPCALGMLVLSKSFGVLKAALTPRVLPDEITLVKTNSRMTVFGLVAGGVSGAVAAALAWAFGSPGALVFTAIICVVGGVLCLRIPAWVESTAGEVPVNDSIQIARPGKRPSSPTNVITTLWANSTIRVETGFLALFIAFVVKSEFPDVGGFQQLLLLGVVGVAAGLGGFIGNALGARLPLDRPETLSIVALGVVIASTLVAVLVPGLATAAIVGLVGSTASSLAKVCLDSVIQHEIPEESRASAFGRSESALQLSWVFGGVVGLLIGGVWSFGHDAVYVIGFGTVTFLLILGLAQTIAIRSGRTLIPAFLRRGRRGRSGGRAAAPKGAARPATGSDPNAHRAGQATSAPPGQASAPTSAPLSATSAAAAPKVTESGAANAAKPRKAGGTRPRRGRGRKAGEPR